MLKDMHRANLLALTHVKLLNKFGFFTINIFNKNFTKIPINSDIAGINS